MPLAPSAPQLSAPPVLSTPATPIDRVRVLSERLQRLEVWLGHPEAPPDIERRVVRLAHRLRNELNLRQLALHPAVIRARQARAATAR